MIFTHPSVGIRLIGTQDKQAVNLALESLALARSRGWSGTLRSLELTTHGIQADSLVSLFANSELQELRLRTLDTRTVDANAAGVVSAVVGNWVSLRALQLQGVLRGIDKDRRILLIRESLASCTNLAALDLSQNLIADGISALQPVLLSYKLLTALDLAGNKLYTDDIRNLREWLQSSPLLARVGFARNRVTSDGGVELVEWGSSFPQLHQLDIADNLLGTSGARVLLLGDVFRELDVARNSVREDWTLGDCQRSGAPCSVQKLSLAGNRIGDGGAMMLVNLLQEGQIRSLNLRGNGISSHGAAILCRGLARCPSLVSLDLGWNDVGAMGMEGVPELLGQCSVLEELRLGGNSIASAGAAGLATSLVRCAALQRLDLSCNAVGDAEAQSLASLVGANLSLRVLDLSGNAIGPLGAVRLLKAASSRAEATNGGGRGLERLDLSWNLLCGSRSGSVGRQRKLFDLAPSTLQLHLC